MKDKQNGIVYKLGYDVGGYIVTSFSEWLLENIVKENISRVYFLSRDAFLINNTVKLFADSRNIQVEQKYLYISRCALRLPVFHFATEKEMDDLLFYMTEGINLEKILMRAMFEEEERKKIYVELNLENAEEKRELNLIELLEYKQRLMQQDLFCKMLNIKSRFAYEKICEYFKQEGVFEKSRFMIVDSGWSGSIQHCISRIIRKAGYTGEIVGAYVGMFNQCYDEGGKYLTWLFSERKKAGCYFNTSVFETLLSAPHGMTTGYMKNGKGWIPILKKVDDDYVEVVNEYIAGISEFLDKYNEKNICESIKAYKVIKRIMKEPTLDEVNALESFQFSVEMMDQDKILYRTPEQKKLIKRYNLLNRVGKVLLDKKKCVPEILWYGGAIADETRLKKFWYCTNYSIGKWIWGLFGKDY